MSTTAIGRCVICGTEVRYKSGGWKHHVAHGRASHFPRPDPKTITPRDSNDDR